MRTLKSYYNQQLDEAFLTEMLGERSDIKVFARELIDIFEGYNAAMLGVEDDYLVEAAGIETLSSGQITRLFRGAEQVSKGQPIKKSLFGKLGDKAKASKELATKMIEAIKKGADKLQNSEPVQQFDMKVDSILQNWKTKLGLDNKAVKLAQQFGEYGTQHPEKSAFVIGVLTALTSAIGSPVFGAAVGFALRTALGMAKGERMSSSIRRASGLATLGATTGGILGGEI